ncbi:hypothetical protein ACF0H5_004562 [Mactra antiquata]
MKQFLIKAGCPLDSIPINTTDTHPGTLLGRILQGCAPANDSNVPVYIDIIENDKRDPSEADSGAVLYIVAVLVFYSAGIVTMIIKYLRREKRELEEERILEDFFRSMPAYKKEREQNHVNRIAIHAFHALTSFSYDDVLDDDVSSDDNDAMLLNTRAETIHEVESERSYSKTDDAILNDVDNIELDCSKSELGDESVLRLSSTDHESEGTLI